MPMVHQGQEAADGATEQLWLMRDGGRSEPVPNCQGREGGRAWWSSQPKSEAGGTKRRPPSCQLWPRPNWLPLVLQGRVQAAYVRRWSAVLPWSAARAFSLSLLDRRPVHWTGAEIPTVHEVLRDAGAWCKCLFQCSFLGLTLHSLSAFFSIKKKMLMDKIRGWEDEESGVQVRCMHVGQHKRSLHYAFHFGLRFIAAGLFFVLGPYTVFSCCLLHSAHSLG